MKGSNSLRILLLSILSGCQLIQYGRPPRLTDEERLKVVVNEVQQRVEVARGIRFAKTPKVERIRPEERCKELDTSARVGWVPRSGMDLNEGSEQLWKAVGLLLPTDSSLAMRKRMDCIATQSLYQVNAKRILVFLDSTEGSEERGMRALAHEMVHAMQDQRMDLKALIHSTKEPDEVVGILGAVEGEAEFIATRTEVAPGSDDDCGGRITSALWQLDKAIKTSPVLSEIPSTIALPAYVPYVYGERLACKLHQRMGVAGLDTLLQRPPKGSWQLWHIEAYLANTIPLDWDTAWSILPGLPLGWKPAGQMRTGEARLAGLPLAWDRKIARSALTGSGLGWNGDRLWVASHPSKGDAIFWRLAFVDEDHALDFAKMWWRLRAIRLGVKLPKWKAKLRTMSWEDAEGRSYQISVRGEEVVVAEGFDREKTSQFLRKTFQRDPRRVFQAR